VRGSLSNAISAQQWQPRGENTLGDLCFKAGIEYDQRSWIFEEGLEHWMGRTVHLAGGDIETLELGQPIDGAFDRLYAAFENGIPSIDDEFRNAAFQYFDQYIGSVHAPAAHDHYFICFTPLWNAFMAAGRLDAAEKVWELAFEPVKEWERAHPGELIDKGTLCYFWGATALLRGNLDRGYLLVHQSVEEDSRTSRLPVPPTPSYALVSLNYQKPDQWFRPWVIEQARFFENFVKDYAATHGRPLTIDDVKLKFLDKPPNLDAIFLLTFTLARLRGISGLPDQAKSNAFAGQIELNLLFDLLLVIDGAIRAVNSSEWKFSKQALFLLEKAGHRLDQRDFDDVHLQFNPANFQIAIQDALDGTLRSRWRTLDRLQCDVHLAYELRNSGAHHIETIPIIWKEFDRVQRAILRCFCTAVDFLY